MIDHLLPDQARLLSLCAILRHFDPALLRALSEDNNDEAIKRLFEGEQVLPVPGLPGMFQLRPEVQTATLAYLGEERPGDELLLHERSFLYFLNQMRQLPSSDRRLAAEQRCFQHLEAIRMPLIERREWQRLRQHATAARAADPQQTRHMHRLSLYDGLVAIQTQDFDSGEAILNLLLAQSDIEGEVHMRALHILAHSRWFQSDYDGALARYQQVYTIAGTIDNQPFQGHALHNMGLIYHELGYYAQALDLITQGLQVFQALGDSYHVAHLRYEIGKNAMQLGRLHDARRHFDEAAHIYERLDVQAQLANLYCLQAMLYHALGDVQASETLYLRSLEIGQSSDHGNIAVTMDGQLLLGLLYQAEQRYAQASAAYQKAIALAEQLHNQHSLALAYYRHGDVFKALGSASAAIDSYRTSINLIETLRGNTKTEDVKLGLLGSTQQIYEAIILLLYDQKDYVAAYHFVERARSRAFLDLLADKSPDLYASFDQPVATLAEVQAQLPPDALLIEYYTTGVRPAGEHLLNQLRDTNPRLHDQLLLPARVLIFALTRTHFEVHEARLDPNLFRPMADDTGPGRRWLQDRKLSALYDYLIGPIQHLLAGQQQLFLIPHGPLHHVPFMALRAPGGRYLLDHDGPAIALAPSATVLVRSCLRHPQVNEGTFLALGYNDQSVDLRHAESEARAVARVMNGVAWAGPLPKSAALSDAAAGLRGLHIAGHAIYQPINPLDSYLSLGVEDHLTARAIMRSLNLRAELVTLSACTSGLTQVVPGDELLGLLRSWLYAGATTVVCALWEAADIVARLMMERFYQGLSEGISPGIAFRDAVIAIRETTGRELATTFARWSQEDEGFAMRGALPEVVPELYDTYPYADAQTWASFMLIGRP